MLYENKELVICNRCNELHYEITRDQAFDEIALFNDMFYSLNEEERTLYYSNLPNTIGLYEQCVKCGNDHQNFKSTNRVPYGKTATAIIARQE